MPLARASEAGRNSEQECDELVPLQALLSRQDSTTAGSLSSTYVSGSLIHPQSYRSCSEVSDTMAEQSASFVPIKGDSLVSGRDERFGSVESSVELDLLNPAFTGRFNYQLGLSPVSREFITHALCWQVLMLALFAISTDYHSPKDNDSNDDDNSNSDSDYESNDWALWLQGQSVVILGFGLVGSQLSRLGYTSMSVNLLCCAICIQWGTLCVEYTRLLFSSSILSSGILILNLNLDAFIQGSLCCLTVMISQSALLGRVTPMQSLYLCVLEVPCYAVNRRLICQLIGLRDSGGSVLVHMFGAYFGLSVSFMLGPPGDTRYYWSDYRAEITAMIGTFFTWIGWPSWMVLLTRHSNMKWLRYSEERALINSVLSLSSSTITTFALSLRSEWRLGMSHLRRCTLAGGVAIAASAPLYTHPAGAIVIGVLGSMVSVHSMNRLEPMMMKRFRIFDTCHVHSVHGLPGLMGGLISAMVIAIGMRTGIYDNGSQTNNNNNDNQIFPDYPHYLRQSICQVIGVFVTGAFAVFSGILTGLVIAGKKKSHSSSSSNSSSSSSTSMIGESIRSARMKLIDGNHSGMNDHRRGWLKNVRVWFQDHEWFSVNESYLLPHSVAGVIPIRKHSTQ